MEPLLDVLFMFDSVLMDLYPACAEEMYSDYCNKINVVLYFAVFIFLYGFLESLRQGLHVVALLGLPPRC
jgi:hypothetical protein